MRVCYVLEDTALYGGVKVVLHQANLLAGRGHEVIVVSKGGRPSWYALHAEFRQVSSFAPELLPEADITVATLWTTIPPVAVARPGRCIHYCQGWEGGHAQNRDQHPAIRAAYELPVPCMAVSSHLAEMVWSEFGRPARVVPPAVEAIWRPAWRRRPGRPPRILLPGMIEVDL